VLVDNHRHFLAFLERRLGDRGLAEDILQEAFVRGVGKLGTLNQEESVVAWFYRLLRNAVTDHYRRRAASNKKLETLAHELEALGNGDPELSASVCACVSRLAETLKPEYAEALRRVEIDGVSVKSYADEAGISSGNAGVRIFRAREALKKRVARSCGTCADHGCLDCTCESSAGHCG
jgi:RNA polymerase sigma-70 factor (ECF subfamily)